MAAAVRSASMGNLIPNVKPNSRQNQAKTDLSASCISIAAGAAGADSASGVVEICGYAASERSWRTRPRAAQSTRSKAWELSFLRSRFSSSIAAMVVCCGENVWMLLDIKGLFCRVLQRHCGKKT